MKSQYLYQNGWVKINVVTNESTAVIARSASTTGVQATSIVTMNEIELSGAPVTLSSLEISYTAFTR